MSNKEASSRSNLEIIKHPDVTFSSLEQKSILNGITSHLSIMTHNETRGVLTPELLEETESLRKVYCKISDSLKLSDKMTAIDWFTLGISDRVSQEQLEKWTHEEDNLDFQSTAKYFFQKQSNFK